VWGPEDGYMPADSATAYLRDLPDAEIHLLRGAGHWLLETHFDDALPLVRDFLARVYRREQPLSNGEVHADPADHRPHLARPHPARRGQRL
jgi:hypothetical protein